MTHSSSQDSGATGAATLADATRAGRSAEVRIVCKGAWSLGTACGKCGRCAESARAEIERLKRAAKSADADAEMYAKAWQRELGRFIAPKRHHIDACVIGTRNLVSAAEEHATYVRAVKEWARAAETARIIGVPEPSLFDFLPKPPRHGDGAERVQLGNSGTTS